MTNPSPRQLALWMHYATGGIRRDYDRILLCYPEAAEAFEEARHYGREAFRGLREAVAAKLAQTANGDSLEQIEEELRKKGIAYVTEADGEYPSLLREIADPPAVLFVKGRLNPDPLLPVAVIGARQCTRYGVDTAKVFSRRLAEGGCTVISGMAQGIDAAAAEGALAAEDADWPTVAVLGTGVDVVYPKVNETLYARIAERGAVISEFLPGAGATKGSFPMRNRIISGMSRGVLVVEAGERSGTSITAGLALEQGREVFAIPGRLTDPQSRGSNHMIRMGEAKAVFEPEDILLELLPFGTLVQPEAKREEILLSKLPGEQAEICALLLTGEKSFDEIAEATGTEPCSLGAVLTEMEFSGLINPLPGRQYGLNLLEASFTDDRHASKE